MSEPAEGSFEREVRDTVVKSSLTGVAATVLAVTVFSPAGLGGLVGTSLASGIGADTSASADNPYANLPAYPAPLTPQEVSDIRGQLASTTASMEFTRAATEARIEHVRSIAMSNGAVTFAPMPAANVPQLAEAAPTATPELQLRLTLSEPASAPVDRAAPVEAQPVRVSYGGGADYAAEYRDPHLELAELFLAHSDF